MFETFEVYDIVDVTGNMGDSGGPFTILLSLTWCLI